MDIHILRETMKRAADLTNALAILHAEALVDARQEPTVATKRRLEAVKVSRQEVCRAVNRLRHLKKIEAREAPCAAGEEAVHANVIVEAADHVADKEGLLQVADLLRDGKVCDAAQAAIRLPQIEQDWIPMSSWSYLFTRASRALMDDMLAMPDSVTILPDPS